MLVVLAIVFTLTELIFLTHAIQDGFGLTPVMGYNTYNAIGCSPNETWVAKSMNDLKSTGFLAAGYKFWQLDCGWAATQRQSNGSITYDTTVFPNGILPLSQLARELGIEWSMYTDLGVYSCDTNNYKRTGSLGYETQDALQFAGWGVAYIKVDNCFVQAETDSNHTTDSELLSRYTKMSNALLDAGIKGIDVCQWGVPYLTPSGALQGPAQWAPSLATSFRVADDITQGWDSVVRIMNQAIPFNLRNLTGPGAFLDMDLLEVGNPGMTQDEQASHFAIWAFFKSNLMISAPFESLPADIAAILMNKDVIAINQDPLAAAAKLVQRFTDHDLFAGPLSNGDVAVLLLDSTNAQNALSVDFADLGIVSADVKNLWSGAIDRNVSSYSNPVNAHGSLPLLLTNVITSKVVEPTLNYYEGEAGQLASGARTTSCSACSGGSRAAFIGNGGSLTFTNITTSQETQNVRFDYLVCAINFAFVDRGDNVQGASISVNNQPAVSVLFPLSGYDWDLDVAKSFLVRLSGFNTSGSNSITITALQGSTQYAPDIDRIGILA